MVLWWNLFPPWAGLSISIACLDALFNLQFLWTLNLPLVRQEILCSLLSIDLRTAGARSGAESCFSSRQTDCHACFGRSLLHLYFFMTFFGTLSFSYLFLLILLLNTCHFTNYPFSTLRNVLIAPPFVLRGMKSYWILLCHLCNSPLKSCHRQLKLYWKETASSFSGDFFLIHQSSHHKLLETLTSPAAFIMNFAAYYFSFARHMSSMTWSSLTVIERALLM